MARSRKARQHKPPGGQQAQASECDGTAIAVGSLLDGIPEAVVLGVSLIGGGSVSVAMLPASLIATASAVAAGVLLTMVADTMIFEAVETEDGLTGVPGLLVAFALSQGGERAEDAAATRGFAGCLGAPDPGSYRHATLKVREGNTRSVWLAVAGGVSVI